MQQQNIFDELYRDTETEPIQGLDGLSQIIYQTEPPAPTQYPVQGRSPKKKVTYYLSEKVVVELCEAKAKIRVMVPQRLKKQVSMSRIVDYAVDAILDEFNAIGKKSELVKRIMAGI